MKHCTTELRLKYDTLYHRITTKIWYTVPKNTIKYETLYHRITTKIWYTIPQNYN